MTGAGGILGVWLTPAIWLALPALFLAQGAGALWAGLLLVAAPLLALSLRGAPSDPRLRAPVPLIHIAALFLAVIALIWAGLIVAGDVALRLGGPRWHGIALACLGQAQYLAVVEAEPVAGLALYIQYFGQLAGVVAVDHLLIFAAKLLFNDGLEVFFQYGLENDEFIRRHCALLDHLAQAIRTIDDHNILKT